MINFRGHVERYEKIQTEYSASRSCCSFASVLKNHFRNNPLKKITKQNNDTKIVKIPDCHGVGKPVARHEHVDCSNCQHHSCQERQTRIPPDMNCGVEAISEFYEPRS